MEEKWLMVSKQHGSHQLNSLGPNQITTCPWNFILMQPWGYFLG
jgi:hypothetical protein